MRRTYKLAMVAVLLAATKFAASSTDIKAPDFSLPDFNGRQHSLTSLTKDKVLVLYFINRTCSVNPDAVKYFKRLHAAYGDRLSYYGVINANERLAKEWAGNFSTKFPLLLDPQLKVVRAYGMNSSPSVTVVDKSGTKIHSQLGYSQKSLKELNGVLAKATGKKPVALDVSDAPKDLTAG